MDGMLAGIVVGGIRGAVCNNGLKLPPISGFQRFPLGVGKLRPQGPLPDGVVGARYVYFRSVAA